MPARQTSRVPLLLAVAAALVVAAACGWIVAAAAASGHRSDRLLAPVSTCPGSGATHAAPAAQLETMACLVAYAREQAGVPALRETKTLDRAGALKLQEIIYCRDFSHTPCGRTFDSTFAAAGYPLDGNYTIGENLAYGQARRGSPRQIMLAWLGSPDHRANLLDSSYSTFGLAAQSGVRFHGAARVALWVNEFGSK